MHPKMMSREMARAWIQSYRTYLAEGIEPWIDGRIVPSTDVGTPVSPRVVTFRPSTDRRAVGFLAFDDEGRFRHAMWVEGDEDAEEPYPSTLYPWRFLDMEVAGVPVRLVA